MLKHSLSCSGFTLPVLLPAKRAFDKWIYVCSGFSCYWIHKLLGKRGDPEIETFSLGRKKENIVKQALRERRVGTVKMCVQELRGGGRGAFQMAPAEGKRREPMGFWGCFAGEPVPRPPSYVPEKLSWILEIGFTCEVPCADLGFCSSSRQLALPQASSVSFGGKDVILAMWLYQQKRVSGLQLELGFLSQLKGFWSFRNFCRLVRMHRIPWIKHFWKTCHLNYAFLPILVLLSHLYLHLLPWLGERLLCKL